jgi:tRNA-specific 2-thiouridylase
VTLDDNGTADVCFDSAQRAVTPGQSMVFYARDVCLDEGLIRSTLRDDPQGGSTNP